MEIYVNEQIKEALSRFGSNSYGDVIDLYNETGENLYEIIDEVLSKSTDVKQYDINKDTLLCCPNGTLGFISFAFVTKLNEFHLDSLIWRNIEE